MSEIDVNFERLISRTPIQNNCVSLIFVDFDFWLIFIVFLMVFIDVRMIFITFLMDFIDFWWILIDFWLIFIVFLMVLIDLWWILMDFWLIFMVFSNGFHGFLVDFPVVVSDFLRTAFFSISQCGVISESSKNFDLRQNVF